jgi:hypothetical protein
MTPSVFALFVVLSGLLAPRAALVPFLLVWCLFGGTAAVALPALGGATVTPAVLFLPFLVVRAWLARGASLRQVPKPGFWLSLLALWGAASAVLLPRLFAGQVQILSVDRNSMSAEGPALFDLRPVSGNLTQCAYAFGAVGCFLSVRALTAERGGLERLRDGVLLLGALNLVAAAQNLGEYYVGFPALLDAVRTASYAMFEAHESAGLLRIQGTFPETSAFSAFTLPLFAFSSTLWLERVRPAYSGLLAAASLGLLALSTSGTAYAGLLGYLGLVASVFAWRAWTHGRVPRLRSLVAGLSLAFAALGVAVLFEVPLVRRVQEFFAATLLGKLESDSGLERGTWNAQAWSNFLETYGIGTGLGSARASSYPLVLLSNVGLVGTLLFAAFLTTVCRHAGPPRPEDAVPRAARQALLAALVAASLSGTVFDLGVAFYAFAAAASLGGAAREPSSALGPLPALTTPRPAPTLAPSCPS